MTDHAGFVFHFGGHAAKLHARPGAAIEIFTEDAFSGKLTSVDGRPREVAPFPKVNPLVGPIAVEGVASGDIVAIHLIRLTPARDWGVATISPSFGALSGTRLNPNFQPEQAERVWIWTLDRARQTLTAPALNGSTLAVPLKPFHGIIGVAPPHGEVRLSVVPDVFGGNLDLPDLGAGATLYLRAHVDGGHVYVGDGHYAQGDGEISGTAVEGALNTRLAFGIVTGEPSMEWPRIETDDEIGSVGCARPLEDAARIAAAGLIRWVGDITGLDLADAQQLVAQAGRLRIGNLVNPLYSVAALIPKRLLPAAGPIMSSAHGQLRAVI